MQQVQFDWHLSVADDDYYSHLLVVLMVPVVHFLVHIPEWFQFDEEMNEEINPKRQEINLLLSVYEIQMNLPVLVLETKVLRVMAMN